MHPHDVRLQEARQSLRDCTVPLGLATEEPQKLEKEPYGLKILYGLSIREAGNITIYVSFARGAG